MCGLFVYLLLDFSLYFVEFGTGQLRKFPAAEVQLFVVLFILVWNKKGFVRYEIEFTVFAYSMNSICCILFTTSVMAI